MNWKPPLSAVWLRTWAAASDVQNIDLMNLAGFCRNCLSKWYKAEADESGSSITLDDAREVVYGMPYSRVEIHVPERSQRRAASRVRQGTEA